MPMKKQPNSKKNTTPNGHMNRYTTKHQWYMEDRFFSGIIPPKCKKQMWLTPALFCISSGKSIPGELLLSRAHFRFDSIAKLTQ
jgi:hypothetical protein